MGRVVVNVVLMVLIVALIITVWMLSSIVRSHPVEAAPAKKATYVEKIGDQELAYLLVKLELKTRAVMAGHYTRSQSTVPRVNTFYRRWLAKNKILPAAVADGVFSEVVPGATGDRAWVKMVVEEPRNPNNRGDAIALELLKELQGGKPNAERSTPEAYYYAEPIEATLVCLSCHGAPKGVPDPSFPEYTKEDWKEGQIIGEVIARVEPEK